MSHPRIVRNHAVGARPNIAFHSRGIAQPFFGRMMICGETRAIDRASKIALLALSLWMAWTYPWYLVLMGGQVSRIEVVSQEVIRDALSGVGINWGIAARK